MVLAAMVVIYAVKYVIRNAFAIGGVCVIIYLFTLFYGGSALYNKIQGSWRGVDCAAEYVFTKNKYIHGPESGTYKIHGNKIFFGSDREYFLA